MATYKSQIIAWYLSEQRLAQQRYWCDHKARLTGDHRLTLFYEVGDPHSHLCAQLLPLMQQGFKRKVEVCVVPEPEAQFYPQWQMQREQAQRDAQLIAPVYGLNMPEQVAWPTPSLRAEAVHQLMSCRTPETFAQHEAQIMPALLAGDAETVSKQAQHLDLIPTNQGMRILWANQRRRRRLGHYLPAMWHFRGEWFWGVDRLDLLQQRLEQAQLWDNTVQLPLADYTLANLPNNTNESLEFYFSFRSPYSYLAAVQLQAWLQQHPNTIDLKVRPVLPMAMRGHPVPKAKRLYIAQDAARRARQFSIPFGRVADPIGLGAKRALAAFPHAADSMTQLNYCVEVATQSWAMGEDIANNAGLKTATDKVGLDWPDVAKQIQPDKLEDNLGYAQANRDALFALGCWGVPTFKLGDLVVWGQDRLPIILHALQN